ncbi:MAG: serine hydrolase [Alphaproteobacteria bacterium]|nr:serine hydrolase [Alphaproteobacteria bacterium]
MSTFSPIVDAVREVGALHACAAQIDGLARAAPSAVGVDAGEVEAFLNNVEAAELELHSLMLHRAGHVAVEAWWWPYRAQYPHIMHSLAKSFTAAAIGLALEEGRFALDDKIVSFFPEFLPPLVNDNLAAMTVKDLLTMRTGHAEETSGASWRGIETSWIAEFFKIPVVHRPGTTFVYTSAASYMLSAILTKATGETLHDYLKPRLLEPLGIIGEHWDIGPDGINPGGNGLTCKTADILKFGVLHAQKGIWNGKRLLPQAWIETVTRPHGGNDYGYHWVTDKGGSYRALGVFVQMVMVFPQAGGTLALTAGIGGSHLILPLVHRHFPKLFRDAPFENAKADAHLKARLATLSLARQLTSAPSQLPLKVSGVRYRVECNPLGVSEVRFDFSNKRSVFYLTDAEGEHVVFMGNDGWLEGQTDMPGRDLHHGYHLKGTRIVAGANWLDATTLQMIWIFVNTAFRDTVICRFEDDGSHVTIDRSVNVNSSALSHPTLVGARARN